MITGGCLLLWQIIIKITIGRRFFLRKQAQKKVLLLLFQYPGTTQYDIFPKLKNPDMART